MLGKLVKYDLKYGARIFVILHAILMIACILGRLFFMDKLDYGSDRNALVSFIALFFTTFTMLFSTISCGALFLIAVRFYKNLFTDEGYLTWTLPATPTQQLGAKIISGTIWYVLSILIGSAGILLLVTGSNTRSAYAKIAAEVTEVLGMPLTHFAGYMFLFTLLCTLGCVIILYLSIAIGQLFPGHRVLCSIIAYFCISIVNEIFILLLMFIFNVFPPYGTDAVQTGVAAAEYILTIFKMSAVFSLFMAIIGYLLVNYILNKKVNLS